MRPRSTQARQRGVSTRLLSCTRYSVNSGTRGPYGHYGVFAAGKNNSSDHRRNRSARAGRFDHKDGSVFSRFRRIQPILTSSGFTSCRVSRPHGTSEVYELSRSRFSVSHSRGREREDFKSRRAEKILARGKFSRYINDHEERFALPIGQEVTDEKSLFARLRSLQRDTIYARASERVRSGGGIGARTLLKSETTASYRQSL